MLFDSCRKEPDPGIQQLIQKAAKIEDGKTVLNTALIIVSADGKTEDIKALIKAGADPNAKDDALGQTALMIASTNGKTESIEALIKAGADPNAKTKDGKTALMIASTNGRTESIEALIKAGADPNAKTKDGKTALMIASTNGKTESIEALIKAGADPNAKDDALGLTALMIASTNGKTECVEALIKAGANPNAKNEIGETVLMMASYLGKTECVEALIKAGANPNAKNEIGETVLMMAVQPIESKKAFIPFGINFDFDAYVINRHINMFMNLATSYIDSGGNARTALDNVTTSLDKEINELSESIAKENGINRDFVRDLLTDFIKVKKEGKTDCVEALIKAGADPNARTEDGKTATNYAIYKDKATLLDETRLKFDIILALHEAGAKIDSTAFSLVGDNRVANILSGSPYPWSNITSKACDWINGQNTKKMTKLMQASQEGKIARIKALIGLGADVNEENEDGVSALMIASLAGQTDCVKALIEARADINHKCNRGGYTALMFASCGGQADCVKALIEARANVNERSNEFISARMMAKSQGHHDIVRLLTDKGAR
jgi:ankyrin repeat protein